MGTEAEVKEADGGKYGEFPGFGVPVTDEESEEEGDYWGLGRVYVKCMELERLYVYCGSYG